MSDLDVVLLALGGNVALTTAVAFLAQAIINHRLNKDVKTFEAELKGKADTAIESLKGSLQIASKEHEIRYSALHAKRAEVVAELHRQVVEAGWSVEDLVAQFEFIGEPSKREKYKKALATCVDCYRYFVVHQLYLPEDLCQSLDALLKQLRGLAIDFGVHLDDDEPSREGRMDMIKAWRKASSEFHDQVPAAAQKLRREFRILLGENQAGLKR